MSGAILTFLGVCAIFSIYMSIVHSFLRAAEEPDDATTKERPVPVDYPAEGEPRGRPPRLRHLKAG
jgi:hypothetical protein